MAVDGYPTLADLTPDALRRVPVRMRRLEAARTGIKQNRWLRRSGTAPWPVVAPRQCARRAAGRRTPVAASLSITRPGARSAVTFGGAELLQLGEGARVGVGAAACVPGSARSRSGPHLPLPCLAQEAPGAEPAERPKRPGRAAGPGRSERLASSSPSAATPGGGSTPCRSPGGSASPGGRSAPRRRTARHRSPPPWPAAGRSADVRVHAEQHRTAAAAARRSAERDRPGPPLPPGRPPVRPGTGRRTRCPTFHSSRGRRSRRA